MQAAAKIRDMKLETLRVAAHSAAIWRRDEKDV